MGDAPAWPAWWKRTCLQGPGRRRPSGSTPLPSPASTLTNQSGGETEGRPVLPVKPCVSSGPRRAARWRWWWLVLGCFLPPDGAVAQPDFPGPASGRTLNLPIRALTWSGSALGTDLIENGGFERGDLTGWRDHGNARRRFTLVHLPPDQVPGDLVLAGHHAATSATQDPGAHALIQEVAIPGDATAAILSWADRWTANGPFRDSPQQRYRVEIRAPDQTVLATLFQTAPDDPTSTGWTPRSADVSAFIGHRVVVAFVNASQASRITLALDDIRLDTFRPDDPGDGPEFVVRFAEGTPASLPEVARVRVPRWTPPRLAPGSTYSWQVVEILDGRERPGPVWTFSTPSAGPAAGFGWFLESTAQVANRPFSVRLEAQDPAGQSVGTYAGAPLLAALAPGGREAGVLIRFVDANQPLTGFVNVTTQAVALAGWDVFLYDAVTWPEPRLRFAFPSNAVVLPGRTFDLRPGGTPPGALPTFFAGGQVQWAGVSTTGVVAVLLRDAAGAVADFVAFGTGDPAAIREPLPVVPEHWIGPGVRPLVPVLTRFVRSGWTDRHTADDWLAFTDGGALSANFTNRYAPGPRLVRTLPPTAEPLVSGVWAGSLSTPVAGSNRVLLATDGAARTGLSDPLLVRRAPAVHLDLPPTLTEGGSAGVGWVRLDGPVGADLEVTLVAAPAGPISVPARVTLPAGTNQVGFAITPLDDSLLNGSRAVVVTARAAGHDDGVAMLRLDDDESTTLAIEVAGEVIEGGAAVTGRIVLGAVADGPVQVQLRAVPPGEVSLPRSVTVPAGARQAPFEIRPWNNRVIDGDRPVRLEATVPHWPAGTVTFQLHDDEDRLLRLDVPTRMGPAEPASSLIGRVRLSGTLREPVEIRVATEPTGWVSAPESVVIPVGALEVSFPLSLVPGEVPRGARLVTLSASATGFGMASGRVEVRDDRLRTLDLAVADLVVHPGSGLIYASVAARDANFPNAVVEVDPVAGGILRHVPVGPDPVPLALTRDGRFLYVGLHGDGTVRRVRLDTMEAEAPFGLDGFLALALVTLPDEPDAVAVNRYAVNTGQDISVYLRGVRQSLDLPIGTLWASDFTAGPDDTAFVFLPVKQRLLLQPDGVRSVFVGSEEVAPAGWRYGDGRLHAIDGRVLDAATFESLPTVSDIVVGSVFPDPAHQRAYYLGNGIFRGGTQPGLGLVEVDMALGMAGEPTVFPLAGTHSHVVRWGDTGLAFGADDTLHLLETAAVPGGSPVNLILSGLSLLEGRSGEPAAWSLTVSNAGPGTATSIRLLGALDPYVQLASIDVSQGSAAGRYLGFEWFPGPLTPGESARATVMLRPSGAGEFALGASVRSLQAESQPADNRLAAILHAGLRLGPDTTDTWLAPARGVAFDPVSERLILSIADPASTRGGDRLIVVNPATGRMESSHPTGPDPGRLERTADGQGLWVAIHGDALLRRFSPSTGTFGPDLPRYPPTTDPVPIPREIWDLTPLPGVPERVVATFRAGEVDLDALLLDEHGPIGPGLPWLVSIEARPDGTRLYGQEAFTQTFHVLEPGPDGLRILDTRPGLFSGAALAFRGDRLYTADGRILDPESLSELGRFGAPDSIASQLLPLPELDRMVFFTQGIGLRVFELSSRRLLGTLDLQLFVSEMDSLIHAGADLLVLTSRDEGGRATFIRTGLLPTEPPANLSIQVMAEEAFVASGAVAGFRLEVTNAGPNPARRVRVAMPSVGYGGSVAFSKGAFAYHDHTGLDGLVETLDPNESLVLTVRIPTSAAGRFAVPVRTWSASADPDPADNFAVSSVAVVRAPGLDQNLPFEFAAVGLTVHPDGTRLYATIAPEDPLAAAGLGVFEILPGLGRILAPRPAGNSPGILAITADGSRLWMVTDGGRFVRRLRIDDWTFERQVPLSDTPAVSRLVPAPLGHDRLAIVRYDTVDILDGEVVRPLPIETTPVGAVTFSEDGERLLVARSRSDFPYETGWLQAFSLRSADFGAVVAEGPVDSHTGTLRIAADRLHLDGGAVRDPRSLEPLPDLSVPGSPMPFPELDRIAFAHREGGAGQAFLRVTDTAGQREVETQSMCCFYNLDSPELVGRWGIDGIVLRTPRSFYLHRSSLLPVREGLDFDGDGLSDTWEREHGLNPHHAADALLDTDGDGASNLDEWFAGTSPIDAASALRLRLIAEPRPVLRLQGVPGRRYLPESAPSVRGPWSPVGDAVEGSAGELEFPLEFVPAPDGRYFRIRLVTP